MYLYFEGDLNSINILKLVKMKEFSNLQDLFIYVFEISNKKKN